MKTHIYTQLDTMLEAGQNKVKYKYIIAFLHFLFQKWKLKYSPSFSGSSVIFCILAFLMCRHFFLFFRKGIKGSSGKLQPIPPAQSDTFTPSETSAISREPSMSRTVISLERRWTARVSSVFFSKSCLMNLAFICGQELKTRKWDLQSDTKMWGKMTMNHSTCSKTR